MSKKKPQVDLFDLFLPAQARTENQRNAIRAYHHFKNLLLTGESGTGKTYLALSLALEDIKKGREQRILIIRSAVATRNVGYLPGNLKEKMEEFEKPYSDICTKLFNCTERTLSPWKQLSNNGHIELVSTSYVRGTTIENATVILDEFQNMSEHEIYTVLTRIGDNCRVIICGDIKQSDLVKESSGFSRLVAALGLMETFENVDFTFDDVVRSEFAKRFMISWAGSEKVELLNETTSQNIPPYTARSPARVDAG